MTGNYRNVTDIYHRFTIIGIAYIDLLGLISIFYHKGYDINKIRKIFQLIRRVVFKSDFT